MKFTVHIRILFVVAVFSTVAALGQAADDVIWFDALAQQFTQSLPLGNGRLGAMVFGGANEERIVLNENSLWSGGVQGR